MRIVWIGWRGGRRGFKEWLITMRLGEWNGMDGGFSKEGAIRLMQGPRLSCMQLEQIKGKIRGLKKGQKRTTGKPQSKEIIRYNPSFVIKVYYSRQISTIQHITALLPYIQVSTPHDTQDKNTHFSPPLPCQQSQPFLSQDKPYAQYAYKRKPPASSS
jgi:hypothetical protein